MVKKMTEKQMESIEKFQKEFEESPRVKPMEEIQHKVYFIKHVIKTIEGGKE